MKKILILLFLNFILIPGIELSFSENITNQPASSGLFAQSNKKNSKEILNKEDNLHYNKGIIAAENSDFVTALAELDSAIAINPKNTFAIYARATVYYQTGKFPEALSDLNMLFSIDKKDLKGIYLRGVILIQTERYADAIKDFELLTKKDSKNDAYFSNLAYCYQVTGNTEKALKNYLQAEKLGSKNNDVVINLAGLYYQTKNYEKSLEYVRLALTNNIANSDIYSLYVYNLLEQGKCKDASGVFKLYQDAIDNSSKILMNLGICYLNSNEQNLAIDFFNASYKLDKNLVENIFNMGVAQLRLKDNKAALAKFEEFLKVSENRKDLEKQIKEAKEQIDFIKSNDKN